MGKGKGKGKMSAAERKQRLAELERNAKFEELARELQMGEANSRTLRKAWREKMMICNLPEMKEDLQVAWRSFDRALDDKDYSVSVLLDAIDNAGEQKRRSDILHMEQIDLILQGYKHQLNERQGKHDTSIKNELDSSHNKAESLKKSQKEQELHLQTTTFATNQQTDETLDTMKNVYLSTMDTRKEYNSNIRRVAQAVLNRRAYNLSEEHAKTLRDYEESTKDKRKDYGIIRQRFEKDEKITALQSAHIARLFGTIQDLKNKTVNFRALTEKKMGDYIFERDYFRTAHKTIQNRLRFEQELDREQLKVATVCYNETQEYLEKCLKKVQKILTMVELCQNYESFNEKLLICPLSFITHGTKHSDRFQFRSMKKLLCLVAVVEDDIEKLELELEKTKEKSKNLKKELKIYMDELLLPTLIEEENVTIPTIIDPKTLIKS